MMMRVLDCIEVLARHLIQRTVTSLGLSLSQITFKLGVLTNLAKICERSVFHHVVLSIKVEILTLTALSWISKFLNVETRGALVRFALLHPTKPAYLNMTMISDFLQGNRLQIAYLRTCQ